MKSERVMVVVNDRRLGLERRSFEYSGYYPERRTQKDRRSGLDRRKSNSERASRSERRGDFISP